MDCHAERLAEFGCRRRSFWPEPRDPANDGERRPSGGKGAVPVADKTVGAELSFSGSFFVRALATVIYLVKGKDVRHSGWKKVQAELSGTK